MKVSVGECVYLNTMIALCHICAHGKLCFETGCGFAPVKSQQCMGVCQSVCLCVCGCAFAFLRLCVDLGCPVTMV